MPVKPTYTTGSKTTDYRSNIYPIWNTQEMGLIGKIAYSVIRNVVAKNPLAVFNKRPVDNGDTLEQVVVKLIESSPYSRDGAGAFKPEKLDNLAVRYFNTWDKKKFKQTVYFEDLRFVADSVENKEEIADKLVGTLSQSDIYENYTDIKGLFKFGSTPDSVTSQTILKDGGTIATKADGTVDYLKILSFIKNTVKGMQYVNADFNTAGLKRSTNPDDIYIVAPYKLITEIDVESLSGVFNLSKAEIKNRIIEIDEDVDENGNYTIYIVDQNAIQVVTQLYTMVDERNADGLFWNYYLHVTRMFALSPLFDGMFFKVATRAAGRSIK